MTYEEQLQIEKLNKQIMNRILEDVPAEDFINFYLYHNQKETMAEYGIRTTKELTKILIAFNYDFSKPKPSKFKGKKSARSHESYIAGGQKSKNTQKNSWASKSEEEKQKWSEKQKIAHSTESFRSKIKQINIEYQAQLSKAEKQEINNKRSNTMKNHIDGLSEGELFTWINHGFKLYTADEYFFDSFPELCFYLYHKHLNHKITRTPKQLTYFYNNEKHYYVPDFDVNGQLYEIKGDHLFEKLLQPNTLDNAKYQCMLQNNVKILQSEEYSEYEKWFIETGLNKADFIRETTASQN
jgi:hypothetical protein